MNEIASAPGLARRLLLRLPQPLLVVLAFASATGGVVLAAHASGLLSVVPAGAGLAGYLLLFGSVLDGSPFLSGSAEDEESDPDDAGRE